MHSLHKLWISNKNSPIEQMAYSHIKCNVQNKLCHMKDRWWKMKAKQLQSAASQKDSSDFFVVLFLMI